MSAAGRKRLGIILTALSILICLACLTGRESASSFSFAASGREGTFVTPAPPAGTVSINFADRDELTVLPGIGETMAQAIIDERNRNGLFRYPEDLLAVKGIGKAKLSQIRPLLDMAAE